MNIEARAAKLIQRITTDKKGFGTDIIFVKPDNSLTKTITAVATKHMLKMDDNGFKSIGRTASIQVSEAALITAGYPTRDANSEVDLIGHKVTWTDVSGLTWTYTVRNTRPDETIGAFLLILDDYKTPVTPIRVITGWADCKIYVNIVAVPNPSNTQTLDNGDVIPLEYALNIDGTFTVPYLQTVPGMNVLVPFLLNNDPYQQRFDNNGVFTFTFGTLSNGDQIAFNAALPTWG